ncbi:MAG: NAD/NADP octopine/nopaline dehydrogenase family protein [Candidatus Eremiobacterota bacterium]
MGIVGAGNAAHSLAAYLASLGHSVHMLARNPLCAEILRARGRVFATGKLEGVYRLSHATCDPERIAGECRTVFVATTTDAYAEVAARLAPHLTPEHELILFSGKLGGCLEVRHVLDRHGVSGVTVLETDALFASRLQQDGSIWIRGIKKWNLYCSPTRSQTRANGAILERYFSGLEPADNAVQRGVTDFGAMAHPLTMLVNMNRVDRQESFLFYCEGFTERTVRLLEAVEGEFRAVARAYQTDLIPAPELLNRYYGCCTSSLLEAMRSVPNYRTSYAPLSLEHRYLREDVACTLVPLQALARVAGVDTPVVDSVLNLACVVTGEDFARTGRSLARLGLDGLDRSQILARLQA